MHSEFPTCQALSYTLGMRSSDSTGDDNYKAILSVLPTMEKWKHHGRTDQFKQKAEVRLERREILVKDASPTKRTFYQLELSYHGVSYLLSLFWARECLTSRDIWAEKPLLNWVRGWMRCFLKSHLSLKIYYSTKVQLDVLLIK